MPEDEQFERWLDRFFRSYYRHRPVNATFIGVHDEDHLLPDYSPYGISDATREMWSLLRELDEIPVEDLSPHQRLDRDAAEGFLRIQLWEYGSGHFQGGNPSLYVSEAIFGVMSLFLRPFAPIEQRMETAVQRLAAVPRLLEQGRTNLTYAPQAWIERAIDECDGGLAFFAVGIDLLMAEHGTERPELRAAADGAAAAMADFQHWLRTELFRFATGDYACGEDALDLYLRKGHFLEESADEILERAEQQFSASVAALEGGAKQFGTRQWTEALAALADTHPSVEGYYSRYQEVWADARQFAVERRLLTWPDYSIRYVPRPRWAREAAPHLYFLFYRAPAAFDGTEPVEYLVEPVEPDMPAGVQRRLLRTNNDAAIKLNHVIHHGGIGHHVQNWHAYRAESRIGQVAAVDCASRIAMFCGGTMAEGWACYATELMDETGYLTPLESYSMHHQRLRMAARAIVDISLHRGRMALDDAVAFYRDRARMASEAARAEAVKNSMNPGAALMYLVGTDLIRDLRRELRGQSGDEFDLRAFHDQVLSFGSLPVRLIASAMRAGPR